jgi:hypothetical protein
MAHKIPHGATHHDGKVSGDAGSAPIIAWQGDNTSQGKLSFEILNDMTAGNNTASGGLDQMVVGGK